MADAWDQFKDAPAEAADEWAQFADAPVDSKSTSRASDPALYDQADENSKTLLRAAKEGVRQVGRGLTDAAEGVMALPKMFVDIPGRIANAFGANVPLASDTTLQSAPELAPQNDADRMSSALTRGGAGALTGAGAGGALANSANQTVSNVGASLAARPMMQAVSGATSAGSSEFVRQQGGGPVAQGAAGVLGGMAPYTAFEGGKAVARLGRAMVEPFYQGGREAIVGRTLNDVASNPGQAQSNMARASEIVPGSKPTAAEVSKDYGIISTQRAAKAANPEGFATRASQQNSARQDYLSVAAKDEPALNALMKRRDAVTGPLREATFKNASGKAVDSAAIESNIDQLLANPDNAGSRTQQALMWAKDQIAGKTDPKALYAIRKEIADNIAGKIDSDKSFLRYSGGELRKVQGFIDAEISKVGGGAWKAYLTKYRQLSRPIDRMAALQEAQGKASYAPSDAMTGREVLSQAKWKTQVNNLISSDVLTSGQKTRIQNIAADLNRGMSINDPNIRAIGSNTTQDMTAANVLGQTIGSTKMAPLVRSLARPLQFLYKIPEKELQDLLSESLLDPKLGAELMKNASGAQMNKVAALLRERFVASGVGTSSAGAIQPPRKSANKEEQRR